MDSLREVFLQVRGHSLRTLAGGTGTRLVLLIPSPLVHAGLYRRTALELARHARVAVVDMPGSGRSSRTRQPLTMKELSDLVPDLVTALGASSCVLIGHSNSGAIALLAALRHPHSVDTLVLADSIGAHPSASLLPIVVGRIIDAFLEPRLTLFGWPAIVKNLLVHTRSFISQLRRSPGDGLLKVASGVAAPTVLAWGRRDHTMPLAGGRRFLATIPCSRMLVSGTGSHDWIIEEPKRFAETVMNTVESGLRGEAAPARL